MFDFVKSSTTEETKDYITGIVKKYIIDSKEINVSGLLKELETFERDIENSLRNGEKTYLTPKSVKELAAYKDDYVYREQGVRAIIAWNAIYPEMTITLPAKIDMVKLIIDSADKMKNLQNTNPDIYKKIMDGIFENPNKAISSKGLTVLAIPRTLDKVPDWVLPYIDYNTINIDVMSKTYGILESLGMEILEASGNKYFSNIIDL